MAKFRFLPMALAACLVGCASQSSAPAADPTDVAAEPAEPTTDKPGYDEVDPFAEGGGDDDTEASGEETEEPGGEATDAAKPAKKACPELDESTCKVSVGCAWDSVKKCVEE